MELNDLIKKRRSYRALKGVDIDKKTIYEFAEAARMAPSCYNYQPWKFIFIHDKSKLAEIFESHDMTEISEILGSELQQLVGFVLYDGGYSGKYSFHEREGLHHSWTWGDNYEFVIESDGKGLYYDFSTVPEGESTEPRELFKCYKR